MTPLPNHIRQKRFEDIPEPILQAAVGNPVLSQIIHRYTAGDIVTREEMLCQCVLALADHARELREMYQRHIDQFGTGPTVIHFHGKTPE